MVMVAVAGIGYACRWMRQWRCSRQIINPIQAAKINIDLTHINKLIGLELKPIDIDDLQLAVKKVTKAKRSTSVMDESIQVLLNSINDHKSAKKIAIPEHDGVTMVKIKNIIK